MYRTTNHWFYSVIRLTYNWYQYVVTEQSSSQKSILLVKLITVMIGEDEKFLQRNIIVVIIMSRYHNSWLQRSVADRTFTFVGLKIRWHHPEGLLSEPRLFVLFSAWTTNKIAVCATEPSGNSNIKHTRVTGNVGRQHDIYSTQNRTAIGIVHEGLLVKKKRDLAQRHNRDAPRF